MFRTTVLAATPAGVSFDEHFRATAHRMASVIMSELKSAGNRSMYGFHGLSARVSNTSTRISAWCRQPPAPLPRSIQTVLTNHGSSEASTPAGSSAASSEDSTVSAFVRGIRNTSSSSASGSTATVMASQHISVVEKGCKRAHTDSTTGAGAAQVGQCHLGVDFCAARGDEPLHKGGILLVEKGGVGHGFGIVEEVLERRLIAMGF